MPFKRDSDKFLSGFPRARHFLGADTLNILVIKETKLDEPVTDKQGILDGIMVKGDYYELLRVPWCVHTLKIVPTIQDNLCFQSFTIFQDNN